MISSINILDAINCIADSWNFLSEVRIQGCWRKADLSTIQGNEIEEIFIDEFTKECETLDEGISFCVGEVEMNIEEIIDAEATV